MSLPPAKLTPEQTTRLEIRLEDLTDIVDKMSKTLHDKSMPTELRAMMIGIQMMGQHQVYDKIIEIFAESLGKELKR